MPAIVIKGQVIANFIVDLTQVNTLATWIVEVDSSSYNAGAGIYIMIVMPDQGTCEHSI